MADHRSPAAARGPESEPVPQPPPGAWAPSSGAGARTVMSSATPLSR